MKGKVDPLLVNRKIAPRRLMRRATYILERDHTQKSDYIWKKATQGWKILAKKKLGAVEDEWILWDQRNTHSVPNSLPNSEVTFYELHPTLALLELL